jgi:2-aminobenzoate-CoA ligase
MSDYTAHVDTFAREHLPPKRLWPRFTFDLPELKYPDRVNCARVLLDTALDHEGYSRETVLYSEHANWSWSQLRDCTDRIAHVLVRDLGIVPGNRVLLRAPNCLLLVAAWLAVMKSGAIAVTSMPMLRAAELAAMAEKGHVDHAICDSRLVTELQQAAAVSGRLRRVITFGDGMLESAMGRYHDPFHAVDTSREDVCLLAFTSGTTGKPKATMHCHRDVLAMADVVARHLLRTSPQDIYLGSPPLAFTFGLGALLVFPLRWRAASVMLERPTPEMLLESAQRVKATCLFTVPTMYRALVPLTARYDLQSLRRCVSAGEPLSKATSDLWHAATGLRLIDGLGTTEMIHIFISAAGDDIRPGSTGRALPGYEACVLDSEGNPKSLDATGRLAVRGPTGCRYLDDPRQSDYVVNGWNVTGDWYRIDREGNFWFQGRIDDMIISAGYNIAGPEVENAMQAHPAVKECAVIGAPNAERGAIVKAIVVLERDFVAGPDLVKLLQDFVKKAIAPYKYPRAVEFVDSLPKTDSGKIKRFALRQRELELARIRDTTDPS